MITGQHITTCSISVRKVTTAKLRANSVTSGTITATRIY